MEVAGRAVVGERAAADPRLAAIEAGAADEGRRRLVERPQPVRALLRVAGEDALANLRTREPDGLGQLVGRSRLLSLPQLEGGERGRVQAEQPTADLLQAADGPGERAGEPERGGDALPLAQHELEGVVGRDRLEAAVHVGEGLDVGAVAGREQAHATAFPGVGSLTTSWSNTAWTPGHFGEATSILGTVATSPMSIPTFFRSSLHLLRIRM